MEILDELKAQIAAEVGEDELTKEQKEMLMQKYGVIAPRITASETHLIIKEQRNVTDGD